VVRDDEGQIGGADVFLGVTVEADPFIGQLDD